MTNKEKLLQELKQEFEKTKKEIDFIPTFEELENEFFLKDGILSTGFVSVKYSRQLCSRIVDIFNSWFNYFHDILMPNPANMFMSTESKIFNTENDKQKIWKLIKKGRALISLNVLIGLNKNKEQEKKFINQSYNFWINEFKPALIEIMKTVNTAWKKE